MGAFIVKIGRKHYTGERYDSLKEAEVRANYLTALAAIRKMRKDAEAMSLEEVKALAYEAEEFVRDIVERVDDRLDPRGFLA